MHPGGWARAGQRTNMGPFAGKNNSYDARSAWGIRGRVREPEERWSRQFGLLPPLFRVWRSNRPGEVISNGMSWRPALFAWQYFQEPLCDAELCIGRNDVNLIGSHSQIIRDLARWHGSGRTRKCVSALSCCGSRCCTKTNPKPVLAGKEINAAKQSSIWTPFSLCHGRKP